MILVIAVILIVGLVLYPDVFWDELIYKYFWGPVEADKEGRPVDGITEGYNVLSTVVYALLLAVALYSMYRIVRRLMIDLDLAFILSSLPLFLFGGVSRGLEDAGLFRGAIQYFFISPLIYVLVISIFTAACTFGILIRRRAGWPVSRKTIAFACFVTLMVAVLLLATLGAPSDFSFSMPIIVPVALGLVSIGVFHFAISGRIGPIHAAVLATGLFLFLLSAAYAAAFAFDPAWQAGLEASLGKVIELRPLELVIIPGIALALTALLGMVGRLSGSARLATTFGSVNLIMFFSHFLDGSATYRGIDLYGYGEKHVLTSALIEATGTAATLLLVKFLIVLAVILLLDFLVKEEVSSHPNLANVMKFAIIFLGLSPGTRDAVRIALGV